MKLLQNTLSRFVEEGQIAGCAVRVMRNDEVCYEGSFGYADIEKQVKMSSENTLFPIASMSKVVTVAAVMQLYEQGLFKMWDRVSEYLPGFKNPKIALEKPDGSYEIADAKGEVTMRQLFTMTSGVPYDWADTAAGRIRIEKEKEWEASGKPFPGAVEYANLVGQLPLAFEPGEKWTYDKKLNPLYGLWEVEGVDFQMVVSKNNIARVEIHSDNSISIMDYSYSYQGDVPTIATATSTSSSATERVSYSTSTIYDYQ